MGTDDSTPPAVWPTSLLRPLDECTQILVEELKVLALEKRGMLLLEQVGPFVKRLVGLARQRHLALPPLPPALATLLRDAPTNESAVRDEREGGFDRTHRHCLIAMWGAVEVAIEDALAEILVQDPLAWERLSALTGKTKARPAGLMEKRARIHVRDTESYLRKIDRSPIRAAIEMLNAVGMVCRLESETIQFAGEVGAIRNCLLHRGATVDARAIGDSPSLEPLLGKKFEVSEAYIQRVYCELSKVVHALWAGASSFLSSHLAAPMPPIAAPKSDQD